MCKSALRTKACFKDDCKFRKDNWAESVFKIETEKVTRLPIVDVQVRDFGGEKQAFKVEVGRSKFKVDFNFGCVLQMISSLSILFHSSFREKISFFHLFYSLS